MRFILCTLPFRPHVITVHFITVHSYPHVLTSSLCASSLSAHTPTSSLHLCAHCPPSSQYFGVRVRVISSVDTEHYLTEIDPRVVKSRITVWLCHYAEFHYGSLTRIETQ